MHICPAQYSSHLNSPAAAAPPAADKTRIHAGASKNEEELPIFALETVLSATSDFSPANQIGEGGFGVVYKVPPSPLPLPSGARLS